MANELFGKWKQQYKIGPIGYFCERGGQKDEAGVDKSHPLIHLIRGFTFPVVIIKIYIGNRETEQNIPPKRFKKS
jgi:hypothetical protein